MQIVLEALRPDHLERFASSDMFAPIPETQIGQAVAFVRDTDRETLGIVGGWERDGAVELGLILSTEAFRYPVAMHKFALRCLDEFHNLGHRCLRAWPVNMDGARWLRRLGFEPVNSGAFERCRNLLQ